MYEVHDARPGIALRLVPQPGAAGTDASLRRNAGHLAVKQARAAECPVAVVHQVPLAGNPIDGAVLRHR